MTPPLRLRPLALLTAALCCTLSALAADPPQPVPLFPKDGPPQGWLVRDWADVANPPQEGAAWEVRDGILHGSTPRGTWLISEKEYADFILEYDFKLGEQGNSGCGLRFPLHGDPAFDGLEMQMVDPRYYGDYRAQPAELTGALYKALAPKKPDFRPEEWNTCSITCRGSKVEIVLNGRTIINADLDTKESKLERGTPLKQRPAEDTSDFRNSVALADTS